MKNWGLLKLAGIVVIASLVLFAGGGTALAGFSDVHDNHWAAKDINTLYEQGIVGGYPDGTFKPNKTVGQAEAVCLVVRAMGLKEPATGQLPQVPFEVPKWAEVDLQLAVQKGLLQSSDQFSASEGASRAWVARLLVRMIDKEDEAREELLLPSFSDADTIPDWARYYVRVAQDNNLIAGYVDNTFRPNQDVSRAEMVAFLYRVMQQLPGGIVTPGPGDEQPAQVITGTVVRVYAESNALVVEKTQGGLSTLYMPGGADVSVVGSTQHGLNALQVGDQVEVALDANGYIAKITVTSRSDSGNQGLVYELDSNTGLLTLQLDDQRLATYYLSSLVTVKAEGIRFPALQDIKKGDRVKVTVQNNLVNEIELLEIAADARGKVILVDQTNRIINLQIEGRLQAYQVPTSARVIVPGLNTAYLSDIRPGDTLQVRVQNGQVTTLEVVGRSAGDNLLTGTVVAVDVKNQVLTIKNQDGRLIAYELNKNARLVVNGKERDDLADFKRDMEVKFRLLDDEIIYVATDNQWGGTIISLDTSGMIMVFQRDNGDRKTYVIDKNVDINSRDNRDRLNEVKRGDYAHILVQNDRVTEINLRTIYTYRVEEVREAYDRLEVVDEKGKSTRLYIRDEVELVVSGNSYASIKSVRVGDTVQAVYAGDDLKKVEVLVPRRGEVTSLDATGNVVYLRLLGGGSASVDFKGNSRVESGNRTYYSISALNRGDRVEVVENQQGESIIKVMDQVSGQLAADGYSPGDGIYLVDGSGWKRYNVYKDVQVRDSYGYSTSFSNLKKGNQVSMYLLWDQVYEITVKK